MIRFEFNIGNGNRDAGHERPKRLTGLWARPHLGLVGAKQLGVAFRAFVAARELAELAGPAGLFESLSAGVLKVKGRLLHAAGAIAAGEGIYARTR